MIRQILILINGDSSSAQSGLGKLEQHDQTNPNPNKEHVIHQEGVSNDIGDNNKKDNSTENKKFIACLKVSGEGNFPAVWSFFFIYQCTPYINLTFKLIITSICKIFSNNKKLCTT